jgi:hypothetical protein
VDTYNTAIKGDRVFLTLVLPFFVCCCNSIWGQSFHLRMDLTDHAVHLLRAMDSSDLLVLKSLR